MYMCCCDAGDEVYGDGSVPSTGSFAEYDVVDQNTIAIKPSNISFEEAASFPGATLTAYQVYVISFHCRA